jgi:periplasmic protein TonB
VVNAQPMTEPLTEPIKPTGDEVYTIVEEAPQFPGGQVELNNFLVKNLKYPNMARECDCQGRVFVSFIVDKDGSITSVEIIRKANSCSTITCYDSVKNIVPCNNQNKVTETVDCDVSGLLDKEALRVVKIMPKWEPGKQNGKAVKVKYIIPVKFALE